MLSATTQISIKSALDTMLTWTSLKINKPAPEILHKKKDIFNIVMTPDRIPKFFIPSLDVNHMFLHVGPVEGVQDLAKERHIGHKESVSPRTKQSHSNFHNKRVSLLKGQRICQKASEYSTGELEKVADHSDPATRAALSLPHLPKITTPYGFLTLGESPNIRRKESLFFDHDTTDLQILFSQRKKSNPLSRNPPSPLKKQRSQNDHSTTSRKPSRSVSWEIICQSPPSSPFTFSPSGSTEELPVKCEKKRFQLLMKKHLSGIKRIKSNSGITQKLPVSIGRTQSNPLA
ncbi:uncharacterized protein LOC142468872 [Ascaphus truei]|uniref:uncharacterized protein LOC142468872 n=1 Tax=Ascaphus truei TaxID=8439 RepID=UPI003F597B30